MAKADKAKPGQRKIPVGTWNRICDMLAHHEINTALGSGGGPPQLPREQNTIRVKNESGAAVAKGSTLRVEEYLLDAINRTRLIYKGTKVTRANQMVATLQWTAAQDETVEAQISGIGLALVNVGATWHTRAYPVKDATVLTSGIFGPVEILGELTTTGEQMCVCRFGIADNRIVLARVATGGITAASWHAAGVWKLGTGSVQVWGPTATLGQYEAGTTKTATVYNAAAGAIDADAIVLLSPNDEWLPVVTLEPCDMPAEPT